MAAMSLVFDILARDRASRELNNVGNAAEDAGKKGSRFGDAMKAGLAVGAVAAAKFATDSVKAYVEAEQSATRLDEAYKKFPKTNDVARASFDKLNEALAKKTRFDDDATASGQAVLAQFGLTGTQIQELTPLLQDYAAKTGKSLPDAAAALGKATLGQGRALKEVGINFKDTKDAGQNFEQIMGGLRTQVGGFAEKEGKTAAGQSEILKNRFGEVQEAVGAKLVPILQTLAEKLIAGIAFFEKYQGILVPLIAVIGGIAAAIGIVNGIVAISTAVTAAYNAVLLANPFVLVAGLIIALGVALVVAYKKSETFRDIVDAAFAKVKGAGQALAKFVTDTIPAAFNTVKEKVVGAAVAVRDKVSETWTAIKDRVSGAWSAIKDALATAIGGLIEYIKGRPQQFVDNVQLIWSAIKNAVSGAWNSIRDALATAFGVLIEYIKGRPQQFVDNMQLIWTALKNAIPAAFGLIRDKIGDAFTGRGGILAKVKDLGGDIIDKIVEGIKGAAGKIGDAITSAVGKISLPKIDLPFGDGPGAPPPGGGGSTLRRVQGLVASMGGSISSTYRSPARNKAVGGSPTSYHMDRSNPAVDIVGSTAVLDAIHARLRSIGGWRELLWRVPNHAPGDNPHIHVAHQGGAVGQSWSRMPGDGPTERTVRTQVGEVITTGADMRDLLAAVNGLRDDFRQFPRATRDLVRSM